MRRRRYLAAFGAGTSGLLAGCSGFGGTSTGTGNGAESTGTAVGTESGTGTGTSSASEAFELTNLQAPDEVTLNEPWVFGYSVRNRTNTTRTFRTTISTRSDGGKWTTFKGETSFEVGPGKAKTWRSPRFEFHFLRTVTYRLDALGKTWTVKATPLKLKYGDAYTSPVGLETTVGRVTFRDEKPVTTANATATTTASDTATPTPTATPTQPPTTAADTGGTKWAVVPITVSNPTEKARPAPFPKEFTFRANGKTVPVVPLDTPKLYYRERSLKPNEHLSGNLYYQVSAGADADAMQVALNRSYSAGKIEVVWS